MRPIRTAVMILGALWCMTTAAQNTPPAAPLPPLRVAFTPFCTHQEQTAVISALRTALERTGDKRDIISDTYENDKFLEALATHKVDIALSSSGLFARMIPYNMQSVATAVPDSMQQPDSGDGATIIVRADRGDLTTLASLREKKLVASHPDSFAGFQVPMGEIAWAGYNWESFFKSVRFKHKTNATEEIAGDVLSGRADVGYLRLCQLEELEKEHPDMRGKFKVINEHTHDQLSTCRRSSRLYPAHTVSASKDLPPAFTKQLTLALLEQPSSAGWSWTTASNFSRVDTLMKALQIGPYTYLREWSLGRMLRDYWPFLSLLAALIIGMFAHSLRTGALVKRREAEVRALLSEQVRKSGKIEQLQRRETVSQLSNLIAHSLRQPLTAIRLYAEGLEEARNSGRLTAKRLTDITGDIAATASEASALVESICSYARGKPDEWTTLSIRPILSGAVTRLSECKRFSVRPELDMQTDTLIAGNRFELDYASAALVTEALERATRLGNAEFDTVRIIATRRDDAEDPVAVITIADEAGPQEEAVIRSRNAGENDSFADPLSMKIVRHIIAAHGGRLRFENNNRSHLIILEMPVCRQ